MKPNTMIGLLFVLMLFSGIQPIVAGSSITGGSGPPVSVEAAADTQLQTMAGVVLLADAHRPHRVARPPHKKPQRNKSMKRANRKGVSHVDGKRKPSSSRHDSDVTRMDAEETDEFRPQNRRPVSSGNKPAISKMDMEETDEFRPQNRRPVSSGNKPAISKMDMEETDEFQPGHKGSLGGKPGSKGISTGL